MAEPMSPERRQAFFAALEDTGNLTIACARAKVSGSWVRLHKTRDPAFRAACDAAVAGARATLRRAEASAGTPGASQYHEGEELVIYSRRSGARLTRARVGQWSASTERVFLGRLAASANVALSARAAGMTPQSAYDHRRRWSSFAERWDEALSIGSLRLEAALLRSACNSLEGAPVKPDEELARMSIDDALLLLKFHNARLNAGAGAWAEPGRQRQRRTLEDVKESILRKIEMIRRVSAAREDGIVE